MTGIDGSYIVTGRGFSPAPVTGGNRPERQATAEASGFRAPETTDRFGPAVSVEIGGTVTQGRQEHFDRGLQALAATDSSSRNPDDLTEEEKKIVAELKVIDRKTKAHEQAHASVGGQYASAPSYTYTEGPDGRQYAVGGEVQIDTAPVPNDPEATIQKMEIVKAAALAPAEPSPQDRKVAQLADQRRLQAVAELFQQRTAERTGEDPDTAGTGRIDYLAEAQRDDRSITGPEDETAGTDPLVRQANEAYQSRVGAIDSAVRGALLTVAA